MEPEEVVDAVAQLEALVERVQAIPEPLARMQAAHALVKAGTALTLASSDLRHLAAVELRAGDVDAWPYRVIAEALDLDSDHARQDAQAIVKGRPARRAARRAADADHGAPSGS